MKYKTTDPGLQSFISVEENSHFPIQNLPYGVFKPGPESNPRVGVAIGEQVMDLSLLEQRGFFSKIYDPDHALFSDINLNRFMAMGKSIWTSVRESVSWLLNKENPLLRDDSELREAVFHPMKAVEMMLPVEIGDYTDFYASEYHATNVGTMFRGKENALMPNYKHLPVGYHGRASSIVLSGTDLHRPSGQTKPDDAEYPAFAPSRLVDFELEMGTIIGAGNPLGERIPTGRAEEHLFGLVLVNDWSARDIQKWEYVPLGPFLSKNFGTSISPWVVTLDALAPFRVNGLEQKPEPLEYLQCRENWGFDIQLEVAIQLHNMDEAHTVTRSNMKYLYWNICQQMAHHTITGCNLRTGDMLATGTISGPEKENRGCLLELTWKGTEPIVFPNGETRTFLQDGDRVTMTGWAQGKEYRVGFGEVTGKILPARQPAPGEY